MQERDNSQTGLGETFIDESSLCTDVTFSVSKIHQACLWCWVIPFFYFCVIHWWPFFEWQVKSEVWIYYVIFLNDLFLLIKLSTYNNSTWFVFISFLLSHYILKPLCTTLKVRNHLHLCMHIRRPPTVMSLLFPQVQRAVRRPVQRRHAPSSRSFSTTPSPPPPRL